MTGAGRIAQMVCSEPTKTYTKPNAPMLSTRVTAFPARGAARGLRYGSWYFYTYMEQAPSRGHSPQSGLGVGCKLCSSSKKLCGLDVRAHARQELLPKYIEQDTKQGPSSQFAERAGSGLQAALQQQRSCVG